MRKDEKEVETMKTRNALVTAINTKKAETTLRIQTLNYLFKNNYNKNVEFNSKQSLEIEFLDELEFVGIDCSSEISLFEYGLLIKEAAKKEYVCIVGVNTNSDGNFIDFDLNSFDIEDLKEWVTEAGDSFYSYADININELLANFENLNVNEICSLFHSLLMYCGIHNLFDTYSEMIVLNYGFFDNSNEYMESIKESKISLENLGEFDIEDYREEFDNYLDENSDMVYILDISLTHSQILKSCVPIAYSQGYNNYTSSYEEEYNHDVECMEEEIQNSIDEFTEFLTDNNVIVEGK